ncbi:hypothetical protein Hanom_Chr04g00359001 [Helianthus anomalus]
MAPNDMGKFMRLLTIYKFLTDTNDQHVVSTNLLSPHGSERLAEDHVFVAFIDHQGTILNIRVYKFVSSFAGTRIHSCMNNWTRRESN